MSFIVLILQICFCLYFFVLVMIRIRHKAMCLRCADVGSKAIPDVSGLCCCYLYSYSRCVWVVFLPLQLFQMCLGRVVASKAIPDVSGSCCCL